MFLLIHKFKYEVADEGQGLFVVGAAAHPTFPLPAVPHNGRSQLANHLHRSDPHSADITGGHFSVHPAEGGSKVLLRDLRFQGHDETVLCDITGEVLNPLVADHPQLLSLL